MKQRKKEIFIITLLLILQTIIYLICGIHKSYLHMDEAYSFGLASYEKMEIQDNEDFYNHWHPKEYYEDYLSVQDDEIGKYNQVYDNQKNDSHPPLYYLLLRFAMGFTTNHFSKSPGLIVNIVIYLFITLFLYKILKKLFYGQSKVKEKAILLSFVASLTMASLTNVIYIRMYALSTLNILITTFLHMKLLEEEKINSKLLIQIGISALIGSLTHYYYLFYLAMMYLIFALTYLKEKDVKKLIWYTLTMIIAGIASLSIFPYSVQQMFFGYRGQGVINNLTDIPEFLIHIPLYLEKINFYNFNNLLGILLIAILGIVLYKKVSNKKQKLEKNKFIKIISVPTLFYFIIVSIASPYIELRYQMPICPLIFILVIYNFYQLLKTILDEKKVNFIVSILLLILLISPLFNKIEPEVLYRDKKEIVNQLKNEFNVPAIYFFHSQKNRFLDDILLFSILDESYIAKDLDTTPENIKAILNQKDISNGIVVFINEEQDNYTILKAIYKVTNLKQCKHLKKLNACDVYYFNY